MKTGRWLPLFVLVTSWLTARSARAQVLAEVAGTQRVCRAGPERALAKAQALRGEAGVLFASVLPNPSIIVEHQRSLSGATDRETVVGLLVPLGIGGRRWILQEAARARRQQALAEAHVTLFGAALAFREAYVAAVIDRARVELLTRQQLALDSLSTSISQLAKGGETASYDGLRQATLAHLHRQALDSAEAKALASRTLLELWTEQEVTLPSQELSSLGGGASALAESGDGHGVPRIESLRAQARAAELEAQAARRRWLPDLGVFGGYRNVSAGSETGHGVSVSLEVPLTFFDHGQGEAALADAERQQALAVAGRLRQQRKVQLKAARGTLARLETRQGAAQDTSRDALMVRDKALLLYRAGEASITELLEAFQVAEEAQLAALSLAQEAALARLALMQAAESMFDAALDRECRIVSGGAQ